MQDDIDDEDFRARLGICCLGCGKKDLVVVVIVVMEEEPLRSDTRLPLESSPYMAENFYNGQLLAGPPSVESPFQPQSPAIYLL